MAAPMAATDQRSISRTALVTGAARGIGLATAEALLEAGHRVAMVDKDADAVRAAASKLPSDRVLAIVQDLAHPDAGGNLARAVSERWDHVTILVNNAGIPSPRRNGRTAGLLEMTVEEWNTVLEVNLSAALRLCRAFIPSMREVRWGRIVCVSSLAGRSRTRSPANLDARASPRIASHPATSTRRWRRSTARKRTRRSRRTSRSGAPAPRRRWRPRSSSSRRKKPAT